MKAARLVLVGYDAEGHVGRHLSEAAQRMGITHRIVSPAAAFDGSRILAKLNWVARGRRPLRLREFSERVVERCRDLSATHMLATGIAPIDSEGLAALRALGVRTLNWLTDDPWNRAHHAPWFISALPQYDCVFTPRASIVHDLEIASARATRILPFAYCPQCHFPEQMEERSCISFVGGADRDRVPFIQALIEAELPVELYGGYWTRYRATRAAAKGFVDMAGYRRVVAESALSLCLLRAANRDDHVMRTYEVPAMGGCMLAQDSAAHRALFGADGHAVRYFDSPQQLKSVASELLADRALQQKLRRNAYEIVTHGPHTYADRLTTILT